MKDAVPARRRVQPDRVQTGPSTRSASASEEKRWIMGQQCGTAAPSLRSFDGLLKESCNCERSVIRPARNPEEHRGVRAKTAALQPSMMNALLTASVRIQPELPRPSGF